MTPQQGTDAGQVICIHGLWMRGPELGLLRRRLRRDHGFTTHQFSYHSVGTGLRENTRQLGDFIDRLGVERAHIVAHSLGGVLALQTLRRFPDLPVERVVCLGSPLVDSRPGRSLCRFGWGRRIVGRSLIGGIFDDPLIEWHGPQQVGVIAGTAPVGLGMLVASLDPPHDGVVSSRETRLPGIAAHLEMPVNHLSLVLSAPVVAQVARFLRDGHF